MSGRDKAPEYGGSGHWITNALAAVALSAIVAVALWPSVASADPCTAELSTRGGAEFAGMVRHVGDGDSLCVGPADGDGATWIEVRLMDFDAPELREPGGLAARDTLRRLALGREAECVVTPSARNGRTRSWDRVHAVCRIDGRAIGEIIRENGVSEGGS